MLTDGNKVKPLHCVDSGTFNTQTRGYLQLRGHVLAIELTLPLVWIYYKIHQPSNKYNGRGLWGQVEVKEAFEVKLTASDCLHSHIQWSLESRMTESNKCRCWRKHMFSLNCLKELTSQLGVKCDT